MKERLDVLLVKQGLAVSREKAKAVIMAGCVYVDNQKEDKAGSMFPDTAKIEVRGNTLKYVSRGGLKLEKAMECFGVALKDKICMDVGSSTGGFTDCMLQNGAVKVYAIDVGHGQPRFTLLKGFTHAYDGAHSVLYQFFGFAIYIKVGLIVIRSALRVTYNAVFCADIGNLGCGNFAGICALIVAGDILRTAAYFDLLARSYHSRDIDCRNAQYRFTGLSLGKQWLEFLDKGLYIADQHIHLPIAGYYDFSVLGIHGVPPFLICQAGRQRRAAPVLQGTPEMRRLPWKYASSYLQSRAFRQPQQSLRRRLW